MKNISPGAYIFGILWYVEVLEKGNSQLHQPKNGKSYNNIDCLNEFSAIRIIIRVLKS